MIPQRRLLTRIAGLISPLLATAGLALAQSSELTGAIFTTVADGTTVNGNIYEARQDVYLNGGPQNQQHADLPDGLYYFQVTNPSGDVLLSTDSAAKRQLLVIGGRVVGSATGDHANGITNPANDSLPVQLYPFDFTPNQGGEYKAWLIRQTDNTSIDTNDPRVLHFIMSDTKTDNFKIRENVAKLSLGCPNSVTQAMLDEAAGIANAAYFLGAETTPMQFPVALPIGVTVVKWVLGNQVGSIEITVADNSPPSLLAMVSQPAYSAGKCGGTVTITASATDCGTATVTVTIDGQPGSPGVVDLPLGKHTIVISATDGTNATAPQTFEVEVKDVEAPVLAVSAPTLTYTPGRCGAEVAFNASASDNCSTATITYSSAAGHYDNGNYTVTVTATDAAGNTTSKDFSFAVADTEAPVIAKLADLTVNNDAGQCGAMVTFSPSASDNCSKDGALTVTASPASGSSFPVGTTTVTITAKDAAGNVSTSTFNVTVKDTEPPSLVVGAPSISYTAGKCGADVSFNAAAKDNCGSTAPTLAFSSPAGHYDVGNYTVTATATDAAGNTTSKAFSFSVVDTEKPVIAPLANISVVNDPGVCGAAVSFSPSATDNCGVKSVTTDFPSGSTFPVGTTKVTVTATDVNDNSSTSIFTVTVTDTEKPVITCPGDITTNLSDPTKLTTPVAVGTATATDNCSAVVTGVRSDGLALSASCPLGVTTITWTAVDPSGNSVTCTQTITVTFKLGAGGGLTLGFWSNKNGATFETSAMLAGLRALNLANANGSAFDPATVSSLSTWLTGASATNMANMLSAQLATMWLNVNVTDSNLKTKFGGTVNGNTYVYAPGTASANSFGLATVNALIAEGNSLLGQYPNTVAASAARTAEEAVKTALDNANNNRNFVTP